MAHPHKRRTQTGDGGEINEDYILNRWDNYQKAGYDKMPKWMLFSATMLRRGFRVKLYEAKRTVSKYVTVLDNNGKKFKVRFSDHKPIPMREFTGDCDFFVGRNNWETNTTNDALRAVFMHFGVLD